jgi:hypothetical protein
VFSIINFNNVPDIYFDTSVSAANKPGGTQAFRRIGSFKTDGSAHIIAFTQLGDEFIWAADVADVAGTSVNTTPTTLTLASVPTGLKVGAVLNLTLNATGAGWNGSIYSPDISTFVGFSLNAAASVSASTGPVVIRTNTSGQVLGVVSTTGGTTNIWTLGWVDTRGRLL